MLEKIDEKLKKVVARNKYIIAGHTDDLGTEEYNIKLSERRAESVRRTLIKYGVDPAQITTKGLGKNEPRQLISETDDEQLLDMQQDIEQEFERMTREMDLFEQELMN